MRMFHVAIRISGRDREIFAWWRSSLHMLLNTAWVRTGMSELYQDADLVLFHFGPGGLLAITKPSDLLLAHINTPVSRN